MAKMWQKCADGAPVYQAYKNIRPEPKKVQYPCTVSSFTKLNASFLIIKSQYHIPLAGERLRPLGHVSADPFNGTAPRRQVEMGRVSLNVGDCVVSWVQVFSPVAKNAEFV